MDQNDVRKNCWDSFLRVLRYEIENIEQDFQSQLLQATKQQQNTNGDTDELIVQAKAMREDVCK